MSEMNNFRSKLLGLLLGFFDGGLIESAIGAGRRRKTLSLTYVSSPLLKLLDDSFGGFAAALISKILAIV